MFFIRDKDGNVIGFEYRCLKSDIRYTDIDCSTYDTSKYVFYKTNYHLPSIRPPLVLKPYQEEKEPLLSAIMSSIERNFIVYFAILIGIACAFLWGVL